jgi:hypothetical protein
MMRQTQSLLAERTDHQEIFMYAEPTPHPDDTSSHPIDQYHQTSIEIDNISFTSMRELLARQSRLCEAESWMLCDVLSGQDFHPILATTSSRGWQIETRLKSY